MNKSSRVALLTVLFSVSASMVATDTLVDQSTTSTNQTETSTASTNTAPTANSAAQEDKKEEAPIQNQIAPVNQTENKTEAKTDDKKTADNKSTMISKITALPGVILTAVVATPNVIADKTYLNALISKITGVKYLKGSFIDKPELIGQAIVVAAAAYAAYIAYNMVNAEEAIDTDEDFFVAEDTN